MKLGSAVSEGFVRSLQGVAVFRVVLAPYAPEMAHLLTQVIALPISNQQQVKQQTVAVIAGLDSGPSTLPACLPQPRRNGAERLKT